MKLKMALAVLAIMIITISLIASVQAQSSVQTKGGHNVAVSELDRGKPTNNKPTVGIATGVVSDSLDKSHKWALIIGINDYAGTINDLSWCVKDAQDFKNALVYTYGWDESHIVTLFDSSATKTSIVNAINDLKNKEQAGDEVVFFYSGHGSTGTGNPDNDAEAKDECIIPYECQTSYFIWDGNLRTMFADFQSQRMMFYFDSCYAGGMTDLAGAGRLILMACGENQLSLESSTWQNGQFTHYFVTHGIAEGLANTGTDNVVTFEEAFDYAKANCKNQTPLASDNFPTDMLP
jgi:uncharacterized caspase-like protein